MKHKLPILILHGLQRPIFYVCNNIFLSPDSLFSPINFLRLLFLMYAMTGFSLKTFDTSGFIESRSHFSSKHCLIFGDFLLKVVEKTRHLVSAFSLYIRVSLRSMFEALLNCFVISVLGYPLRVNFNFSSSS